MKTLKFKEVIKIRLGLQQKVRTLEKQAQMQNTLPVAFLELRNGQYFDSKNMKVDIKNVRACVIIIDDIPQQSEVDKEWVENE